MGRACQYNPRPVPRGDKICQRHEGPVNLSVPTGQEASARRRKRMRDRRPAVPRASSPISRSGPRVPPSGPQAQARRGHGQNARPTPSRSAIGSVPGADQGQGSRVRDEAGMPRPVLPVRPAAFPAPIGIRGAKARIAADRPWRRADRVGNEHATVNGQNGTVCASATPVAEPLLVVSNGSDSATGQRA